MVAGGCLRPGAAPQIVAAKRASKLKHLAAGNWRYDRRSTHRPPCYSNGESPIHVPLLSAILHLLMEPAVIASIIAAATALVAVIVGPFLTIRASKTQMLGPMRQAWINSLRDAVAEYAARIHAGQPNSPASLSTDDSVRHRAETLRADHLQTTYQLQARIALLINANEPEHQELVRLAKSAYAAYSGGHDTSVPLSALQVHTQTVLKKEWNVVKK